MLIKAYTFMYVHVRSPLEYASVVWNPYYDTHVNLIEFIQNKMFSLCIEKA